MSVEPEAYEGLSENGRKGLNKETPCDTMKVVKLSHRERGGFIEMDIRYSANQRDFKRYTTEETRKEFLIENLYVPVRFMLLPHLSLYKW